MGMTMGCEEVKLEYELKVECCSSCHTDWEYGEGGPLPLDLTGGHVGAVCCAVAQAWDASKGQAKPVITCSTGTTEEDGPVFVVTLKIACGPSDPAKFEAWAKHVAVRGEMDRLVTKVFEEDFDTFVMGHLPNFRRESE